MLRISVRRQILGYHLGRDRAQSRDRRVRLVEQSHMGVASRKTAVGVRESRRGLDRNPQPWDCLCETPTEEQSGTDQVRLPCRPCARAEAQGHLSMLDREIRLAGPQPEKTADVPAARVARIEGESAIDQRDHRIEVFAENGECHCGVGQNTGIVARHLDGALEDVFDLQDKVASSVAGVIEPALQAAETARSASRRTSDLSAYDLYLRACSMSSTYQLRQALALLEEAITRDPHYGPALGLAAQCCQHLATNFNAPNRDAIRPLRTSSPPVRSRARRLP